MAATSRELYYQALNREGPARAPRNLWVLPIARMEHPDELAAIERDFPNDSQSVPRHLREQPPTQGDQHEVGTYVDEWGCSFINLQRGVMGEVKEPPIQDWQTDLDRIHIPTELLSIDRDAINRECAATDRFVTAGQDVTFFERLQWLRGPEMFMMDLVDPPDEMRQLMQRVHAFNCRLFEAWCQTDIDAVRLNDDWGSQRSLMINPTMWRELFKPIYRDYVQIAHNAGKKFFMHSDGYIVDIYPDLIEVGVDALNSQIFCMGAEKLEPFAGRITFWGEIDRQYLLARGTTEEVAEAVRQVHRHLWKDGGCIAQCEFGAAAKPENVRAVFQTWNEVVQ